MPLRNPNQTEADDRPAPARTLTQRLAYCLWAAWGFLQCWVQTRRLKPLLQGVPVIGLGLALAVLFLTADQPVSSETIDGYLQRAQAARQKDEFEEAEFYFRKLEQLAPRDRKVVYEHAILHEKQGNYREAFRLMESLVRDEDLSNDIDVHLWLAKTALLPTVPLDGKLDYVKEHLNAILADDPSNKFAQLFFAQLYLSHGDMENAIRHLEYIEQFSPELQLKLASLYQAQGDNERSRQNAQNAVDTLAKQIQLTQTADVNVYHQLAAGQLLLQQYQKSEQTLIQAWTKFNQDATRRQLARNYVAWSVDVARKDPENVGEQMKLLEKALVTAPNEPLALQRMLGIASAEGPGAEEAEQRLRQALVEGNAPGAVHFSLGALAAKRGDSETAMRHFRQSARLNPRTAVTLNNIAYLMAQSQDADLDQALEMINQALEMAPAAAAFRETRGQVLLRLSRWSEAITDLEFANSKITAITSRIAINRALAAAYTGLGDAQTAAIYRQKAEELLAEAQASQLRTDSSREAPELPIPDADETQ